MKRLKMSAPYVLAVLVLLAGIFGTRGVLHVLPSYLDEVKVYDKTSGAGALYVGDEELFIWPWNGYSEEEVREVADDGLREEMAEVFREISGQFAPAGAFPEEMSGTAPAWKTDDQGFLYLKDYTYVGADGKEYTCNMVWEEGGAGLVYYHNVSAGMEKGTDETIAAAMEGMKGWRTPLNFYAEEYDADMEEGAWKHMMEMSADDSYSPLLLDFLERYWELREFGFEPEPYEEAEIRNRMIDLLINAQEDILVYGNELLGVYSGEEMGTMIIYYSPAEERITGFSVKMVW